MINFLAEELFGRKNFRPKNLLAEKMFDRIILRPKEVFIYTNRRLLLNVFYARDYDDLVGRGMIMMIFYARDYHDFAGAC